MSLMDALVAERQRLQDELAKVERAMKDFGGMLAKKKRRGKRVMSAEARKAIGDAARRRWKKVKEAAKAKESKKE